MDLINQPDASLNVRDPDMDRLNMIPNLQRNKNSPFPTSSFSGNLWLSTIFLLFDDDILKLFSEDCFNRRFVFLGNVDMVRH